MPSVFLRYELTRITIYIDVIFIEILPNDNFSRCYCLANIVALLPVISGIFDLHDKVIP